MAPNNPEFGQHALDEYMVLSEDRRQAVHIFVNAAGLATAIVGFGLNYLVQVERTKWQVLGAGLAGLVFFGERGYRLWRRK